MRRCRTLIASLLARALNRQCQLPRPARGRFGFASVDQRTGLWQKPALPPRVVGGTPFRGAQQKPFFSNCALTPGTQIRLLCNHHPDRTEVFCWTGPQTHTHPASPTTYSSGNWVDPVRGVHNTIMVPVWIHHPLYQVRVLLVWEVPVTIILSAPLTSLPKIKSYQRRSYGKRQPHCSCNIIDLKVGLYVTASAHRPSSD